MRKLQYKKWIFTLLVLLFSLLSFPFSSVTASADMGPKPSVQITLKNTGESVCYGTLLSKKPSTGPYSVWNGDEENLRDYFIDDADVWRKFIEYQDEDGFYFLRWAQKVENGRLAWTYYPPSTFKILLYFPETNSFLTSEIYERYAFDSYYTVDMTNLQSGKMTAQRSYDYRGEVLSLAVRILLTILIEILVAWLFGFRSAKEMLLLIGVNALTQVGMNVYLNIVLYRSGALAFLLSYINLEIFIFLGEAILYCILLRRCVKYPKWRIFYVFYALVANLLSFGVGIALANYLPQIF